jgi:hypothetical protein
MNEKLNFRLILDSDQLDPSKIENSVLALEKEIDEFSSPENVSDNVTNKEIDPLLFATLSLSLAPIAAAKFFEFLNAWSLRRENRSIKIKIQLGKDKLIEFEGSETMSKKDVEGWILSVKNAMKK